MSIRRLEGVEWVEGRMGEKRESIYRMCREGILPHVRLGRKVKFAPEQIEDYLRAGGQALPGGWRKEA
ncbi:MAG: helix-turn-helix domain-containing protein [Gemmatimonadetes bacterium]|nr:helix-turn-helix domain-containing protein [Gemmatimonadota bacterium]